MIFRDVEAGHVHVILEERSDMATVTLVNGIDITIYPDGHVEVFDTDGEELFIGGFDRLVGLVK